MLFSMFSIGKSSCVSAKLKFKFVLYAKFCFESNLNSGLTFFVKIYFNFKFRSRSTQKFRPKKTDTPKMKKRNSPEAPGRALQTFHNPNTTSKPPHPSPKKAPSDHTATVSNVPSNKTSHINLGSDPDSIQNLYKMPVQGFKKTIKGKRSHNINNKDI